MAIDKEHFRKLEQMYRSAPINKLYRPDIVVGEGSAEISIQVSKEYFHAAHAMHGAIYFKMLDDASFFAVSSVVTDTFVLTTSFNLHFFRPVSSGKITSRGILHFSSSKLFVAEARLINEDGDEIAFGTGNFMKSRMPLSVEMGYDLPS